jgi:hypothetical protein
MQHAMTMSTTARWIDTGAQWLAGATAIVAAGIALTGGGARSHADVPQERFRVAMAAYEAQRWPQAYAQLSAAADDGDPAAARMAAMMARQGPLLFGQHFDASAERLQRWDQALHGRAPGVAVALTSPGKDARTGGLPPGVQVARAR